MSTGIVGSRQDETLYLKIWNAFQSGRENGAFLQCSRKNTCTSNLITFGDFTTPSFSMMVDSSPK